MELQKKWWSRLLRYVETEEVNLGGDEWKRESGERVDQMSGFCASFAAWILRGLDF